MVIYGKDIINKLIKIYCRKLFWDVEKPKVQMYEYLAIGHRPEVTDKNVQVQVQDQDIKPKGPYPLG